MADGASSNGGDTKTSSEKVSNGQQQQSQPSQAKQVVGKLNFMVSFTLKFHCSGAKFG